MMQQNTSAIL